MKDRISTLGDTLKINSLYNRKSVISMSKPTIDEARDAFKDCVESAATKPREVREQNFLEPAVSQDYPDYYFLP